MAKIHNANLKEFSGLKKERFDDPIKEYSCDAEGGETVQREG